MVRIKNLRLKKYDYKTDGYYFVTAVCNNRANLFKDKESIVENQLKDLQAKTDGLVLDYFVVMPNHVHIIFVLQKCALALGEIVRRFKAKVTHNFNINVW